MKKISRSEITPERVYVNRRKFMRAAGALAVGSALAACGLNTSESSEDTPVATATPEGSPPVASAETDDQGNPLTSYENVLSYANYYEFSPYDRDLSGFVDKFETSPWSVEVYGWAKNPKTYTMEDLLAFEQEERIYRFRCVETWSMVIPWIGFPLRKLLEQVEPLPEAKYVRFETVYAPDQMPGQKGSNYPWPYQEGLRLDEAMHDLTLLATGIYGKPLAAQNGAPIRLVVPWKYGFKSIKSIVKIELVREQPTSLWMDIAPSEYGFYANVNPDVPHPRWSQSSERYVGEMKRRPTLLFNGYDEVASLYEGMDLAEYY